MTNTSGLSFSMLSWALNEELIVEEFLQKAEALLCTLSDTYELIFIDDGSTDRTTAIVEAFAETHDWVKLYINDRNRGPGYNTKRAISLATMDYLFWQTTDWAYDLSELKSHLHLLSEYDVLQGVRMPVRLLQTRSDNRYRAFTSLTNYYLIRLFFHLPASDYQNVTIYPRELIQSAKLESGSSFTNPECLLKVWWKGASIKEFSVPFIKRVAGDAKGARPKAILSSIRDITYYWFKWVVLGRREFIRKGEIVRLYQYRGYVRHRLAEIWEKWWPL